MAPGRLDPFKVVDVVDRDMVASSPGSILVSVPPIGPIVQGAET